MKLTRPGLIFLAFITHFFCFHTFLHSKTPHSPRARQNPSIVVRYTLADLGETDLSPHQLSKSKGNLCLKPSINNLGEVIGNRMNGGFIIRPGKGEYAPAIKNAAIHFYALNNNSDVLVRIHRCKNSVEWYIWPAGQGWNSRKIPIDTCEVESYCVSLLALNDRRTVAGDAHPFENPVPVIGGPSSNWILRSLGSFLDTNFHGTIEGLNNCNNVMGRSWQTIEHFPFLWDGCNLRDLAKLRAGFHPPSDGKIEFENLLLAPDGTIYGNYWINTSFMDPGPPRPTKLLTFSWDPSSMELRLIDLQGMQLDAVNKRRQFVGAWQGKAAYCEEGAAPEWLIDAIPLNEIQGWELLEATDINDLGQIVGYGKLNGKIHLFMADPK